MYRVVSALIQEILEHASNGKIKEAAFQIRKLVDEKEDLQGNQVFLAHILLLSGDWAYINALLPQNTNFFSTSGWLNSLAKGRPLNQLNQAIPWFTYPSIDFLAGVVERSWRIFEWGSGNSTLWWASRVESVVAVEDNRSWFEEVSRQMPQNAQVLYRDPLGYANAINEYPEAYFDGIVVDGSKRNDCARSAVARLKAGGILIFDNSDGSEYIEASAFMAENGFLRIDFWGLIPSFLYKNCTSIYFRDPAVLTARKSPFLHRSPVGISCFQAIDKNGPT